MNTRVPSNADDRSGSRHAMRRSGVTRGRSRRLVVTAALSIAMTALLVSAGIYLGFRLTSRPIAELTQPSPSQPSAQFSATLQQGPPANLNTSVEAAPISPGTIQFEFDQLQASVDGPIGIAFAPLGLGQPPEQLGDKVTGKAWSTIKVPLAITALRAEPGEPPLATDSMRAAITQSDNAAADVIWQSLGDPDTAAAKIDQILRDYGDPTTLVQSRRTDPGFSAFGQTDWTLVDQTRFLASADCDGRNTPILDLMDEITKEQQWGLGTIPGSRFKGGWGPSESAGGYLVRQVGVLSLNGGHVVVAIAVAPKSGTLDDGTADLNKIAAWLLAHQSQLPTGRCPSPAPGTATPP